MKEIREVNKIYNSGLKVDELKGKKVTTLSGKEVGKITQVRLDPNSLNFDGIEIDRGFFGTDTFIGKDYIESLGKNGVVLNMNPAADYKGLHVLDSTGKEVGTVKEIRTKAHSNNISAIVVGTGVLTNDVIFSKTDIQSVGESIMLNSVFNKDAVKVGGQAK
jgi:sporulation protein YlmC with PRC-barrel domain